MTHTNFREVINHFWNSTSIKGLPRSVRSRSNGIKLFWAVATTCCAGMLIWQLTALLVKYYSYIVAINLYVVETAPDFPDVTLCNQNPNDAYSQFELSYQEYVDRLTALRQQAVEASSIEFDDDGSLWADLQSKRGYTTTQTEKFFKGYPPMPSNATFITDCTWFTWDWSPVANKGAENLCKQFVTTFWMPNYYRCYTIRPPMNGLMGFSIIVYLDNFPAFLANSSSLNLGLTHAEGVRLFIHPPNTFELMIEEGINISPGTEVTIRMSETKVSHLGEPYTACTNQVLLDPLDSTYSYSQGGCLTTCRQQQYINACGCAVNYEGFTMSQLKAINYTFCTSYILNPHNESDVIKILEHPKCDEFFWPSNSFCSCLPPCNEHTYDQTITSVHWPDTTNQLAFYDKYIKPYPEIYGTPFNAYGELEDQLYDLNISDIITQIEEINLIPKNFVQLNFQMTSEFQTVSEDIPSVTWDTLFSNLGGTLNLWMGITALFGAEVLELIYHVLTIHCSKARDETIDTEANNGFS